MANYSTPDVYVEESSTLPPSVAEVSTAIPVFIGYTEKVTYNNRQLINVPTRITSFLEFKTIFGDPLPAVFNVKINADNSISVARMPADAGEHNLSYSLDHYYRNGGGDCYIITLGKYQPKTAKAFEDAIDALLMEDEPTLITLSEATTLTDDYFSLCNRALDQCGRLKDRFCIFDAVSVKEFRNQVSTVIPANISYGAAYYPDLQTTLNYRYDEKQVEVTLPQYTWGQLTIKPAALLSDTPAVEVVVKTATDDSIAFEAKSNKLTITVNTSKTDITEPNQKWKDVETAWGGEGNKGGFAIKMTDDANVKDDKVSAIQATELDLGKSDAGDVQYSKSLLPFTVSYAGSKYKQFQLETRETNEDRAGVQFSSAGDKLTITYPGPNKNITYNNILLAWKAVPDSLNGHFSLSLAGDGMDKATKTQNATEQIQTVAKLSEIMQTQTALYNLIKQEINKQRVVLPPSPAMAGIYAAVDRERGVWKAPANVALNSVIAPTVKISSDDQANLNVDSTGGKSINAIRGFMGKGTLVWGARTLAGNDNEWRFINVRRLFNMIEESTKKASYFAVFESNTATTWLKVKGMIESFLYRLWQQGALAGSTPKAAYFVHVGLGSTMTQQDILEGRMIVEIGIAAVRPAEFIVLRFSHKLQEA